ncbi:NAD(P)/FAD-dependent oxidoreductase [Terrabacter sp. Soil810]|uniref:NAD(P)/FAD-dependent oxidoreductase n=1 Tax=Terrabacter sp. Soil810 TaxID=1736418 RepID=UPI000709C682|nr:NAD(P)/FAD-dependent oxidoreductase [Terrabacter sp. Soil810]KRF38135.1 FAD-dependent oxidoreductase [Terrabacter sp. Soil810]
MHTDVAVIGGGPAGLQAALTLGRIHRDAVLFDDGTYRNATVSHMHNVVAHDGTPPADFRADARRQLTAYDTVSLREERVASIEEVDGSFLLHAADGTTVTAYAVVLATGVRDTLPPVPGLDPLWGDLVAHCPFCHGHELSGQRVGILGAANAPHLSALLGRIASELVVLADGADVPDGLPAVAIVRTERVVAVERHDGGVRVVLEGVDGEQVHEQVAGLFVKPELHQSAPFAEQLGLELNPSGAVRVDEFGRSSRERVFCAGDMAHLPAYPMPMSSVVSSMAAGQLAASAAIMALLSR